MVLMKRQAQHEEWEGWNEWGILKSGKFQQSEERVKIREDQEKEIDLDRKKETKLVTSKKGVIRKISLTTALTAHWTKSQ